LGYQASIAPDVPRALDAALESAVSNDLVCCTGSIFTVADAREAWCRRNGLPLPPTDPEL
jgi:folylpolyglutamate synthase/dihydropteroate synthase